MKNSKRILAVKILRMYDESPDTSYYGEYGARPTSEFSIDRAHSEDCASVSDSTRTAHEKLSRILEYLFTLRRELNNGSLASEWEAIEHACDIIGELQENITACDCNENHYNSRKYRYFNPSFNYVDKNGKLADGNTPEEVRKYVREDYNRMESLHAGNWQYIGIRAEAEYVVMGCEKYTIQTKTGTRTAYEYTPQTVSSGGLWGIESDSGPAHFSEVAKEELAELKTQLLAIGFSKRAISTAFKSIEEVEQ